MLPLLPFLALTPLITNPITAAPDPQVTDKASPFHPHNLNHPQNHILRRAITNDPSLTQGRSFDFIVAGGGLSGLAVAARLSEWANTTVLVVEAGNDGSDVEERIDTPGFSYLRGLGGSQYDWAYRTVAQPDALGLQKQWPRGKGLGGSGAINGMYWTRGGREDYDAWNTLNPNADQDWGWSEVTRCINKAENYTAPPASRVQQMGMVINTGAHGTTGPIQAGYSAYMYDVIANWIPAWVSLGIPSKDLADGDTRGATISPLTLNPSNQTRSDSKAGYIDPIKRDNLVILTGYQVTEITYNGTTDANGNVVASGIKFQAASDQRSYTVTANKEVILSGGVIGSPQILQLSGIGPKNILDPLNIQSRVDLPVGYNLQDHISYTMYYNTPANLLTWNRLAQDQNLQNEQLAIYRANRTGMWTFVNAALGYPSMADLLNSKPAAATYAQTIATEMAELLNDTVTWKSFPANVAAGLEAQWKIQQSWINTDVAQMEILMQLLGNGGNEIGIQIAQQHQWARGTIFITSANAFEYPAINPDYFGVGYDTDILAQGAAFARRLVQANPLSIVLLSEKTPGTGVTGDALYEYIKRTCGTEYHPMGTCSMMPRAQGGVVDTNLIVYGTSNIRVVDCSIMPMQLSSHLMATGYGIAEKAAEIIKSKYTLLAQTVQSSSRSATGSNTASPSAAASSVAAGTGGSSTTKGGLSQAATIGVGVGAGVGGALLLGALLLFCCLRKRKQKQAPNEKGWYQPAARSEPEYSDNVQAPKETPGDYQMANFPPPAAPYATAGGSGRTPNPHRISASPSVDTMATADLPRGMRRSSSGWVEGGSGTATPANYEDHYGYPTQPPSGAWNANAQTYSRVQPR